MNRLNRANRTPRWTLPLALAAVLLPAAGARAESALALSINTSVVRDGSFDAVSANDALPQGEVSYALSVMDLVGLRLWLEGSYTGGAVSADSFGGTLHAAAVVHEATVGARLTWPLREWLVPRVRLGGGATVANLSLEPKSGSAAAAADDWTAGFTGHLLGGFELLVPRSWLSTDVTGGLFAEAGYVVRTDLSFQVTPDRDEELRQIPVQGRNLGTLRLSGSQVRIGAVLRF